MIPDRLTKNWGLKVISLVLAIGLWYYALGEESIEVTRAIPLKIEIENPQMTLSTVSTRMVQVTLLAPRAMIVNLASQDISAVHKVGADIKKAGDYSFRIEPSEIHLPNFPIRVTHIEPEVVTVKLDELIVQKLEIQPDFTGDPAIGYKLVESEIKMDPNAILAQGPKGILESMKSVKTAPIDLVGRIRSFHRTVDVRLPPSVTAMSGALVDVYIPVREEFDEKEFTDVPVRFLRLPEVNGTITLDPDRVSFVLKGSKRFLEKLAPEDLTAYVDLGNLKKGEHSLPLQIILPENVSLKDKQPILITATIASSPKN
ncbi:MAG: YbbR-like protein [Candidatus Omnitrophica bacterium ADurb.Bin277]|nr:MAG: YbbR-like protein [Candidatus Omnitrophica bacterium ADurb.Bin277]